MNDLNKKTKKEQVIDLLNEKGFILEDKSYKLLNDYRQKNPQNSVIIEKKKLFSGDVDKEDYKKIKEIDLFVKIRDKQFIIECKRTNAEWFFPKNLSHQNYIFTIHNNRKELYTKSFLYDSTPIVYSDLTIIEDEKGLVKHKRNNLEKDVHNHIYDLLEDIQLYFSILNPNNSVLVETFIPLIVTNATLSLVEYSELDLNDNGDLKVQENKIREVPYLAFNFPKVLGYSKNNNQIIQHKGGSWETDLPRHIKTVFVVNIKSLIPFIELMVPCNFE